MAFITNNAANVTFNVINICHMVLRINEIVKERKLFVSLSLTILTPQCADLLIKLIAKLHRRNLIQIY